MALINCPECNNQVSSEAKTCPMCGYVFTKVSTGPTVQSIIGFILSIFTTCGVDLIGGILCYVDLKHADGRNKTFSKIGYYIVLTKMIFFGTSFLLVFVTWTVKILLDIAVKAFGG